jgi:hypothetical protein
VYSRLLRRLLIGPDVEVNVPEEELPRRFRTGVVASMERRWVNAGKRFRWHVGEPLSSRVTPWADTLRGRREAGQR